MLNLESGIDMKTVSEVSRGPLFVGGYFLA